MDPLIPQLNNEITKQIVKHRDEQWKEKLDQIGDHKKNSHTFWNTINYLRGKKPPSQSNTIISFGDKSAVTPQQKATAFNKQFVNTVKHMTKNSNRKIDKHTKSLVTNHIHITSFQVKSFNNHCPSSTNKPNHPGLQSKDTPTAYYSGIVGSQQSL